MNIIVRYILPLLLLTTSVCFGQSLPDRSKNPDDETPQRHAHDSLPAVSYADSLKIYYSFLDNFPADNNAIYPLDTTPHEFQQYERLNKGANFYNATSNSGHAHKNLKFSPNTNPGFFYNDNSFEYYTLTEYNTKYYSGLKPYTNLYYSQAPGSDRDENYFLAEHNQKLGKTIDFGASFNFLNLGGFYSKQAALNANFSTNLRFNTKDYRYGVMLAYYHSRINVSENGGISNDEDFTKNIYSNRKTIDVTLSDAENLIKSGGWHLAQYFYITKTHADTIPADSTKRNNFLKIIHKTNYTRSRSIYTDNKPDYDFYPYCYTGDESAIFDSTVIHSLTNKIAITNSDVNNHKKIVFEVGTELNYHKVNYNTFAKKVPIYSNGIYVISTQRSNINYNIFSIIPYGKASVTLAGFTIQPEAYFSVGNYNIGDYQIKATVSYTLKKLLFLKAAFRSSAVDAPWMYQHINTTTATWNKTLPKSFYNIVFLSAEYTFVDAGAEYNIINNYSYLDQNVTPQQYNEKAIHYFSAYINPHINIKRFEISAFLTYQTVSNKDIIRVPDFMGKLSFIYKQPLFKKALMTQIGIDVCYNTPFYAEAYMPSIRSFYLQDDVKTGNFPYIDAYFRFQVKRAKIFVEFINVTSGLLGYNYIAVPHYPLNDRQLRFGVSWYFHD